MALWLNQHLTDSTRVLVSPALRTQQTAAALGRPFRTVDSLAPGASVQDVLKAARYPLSREAVLVVGHQPTLGWVIAELMDATNPAQAWSIRKGAVWWLQWREREGHPQVTLRTVLGPDTL